MSDELTPQAVEPVLEGTGTTEASVITEAPDTPSLDINEYSNHRVRIKSNGEELQVPLSEAIAGYQRQSDYTRKTQELSEQRDQFQFASALQAALDNNPESTIELLKNHYGLAKPNQQVVEEQYLDPTERKYRELDRRIASFEDYQNQQNIETEIQGLQNKYGDFDVKEVVTSALKMNSTDLEGVYKQLSYDKMVAQNKLREAAMDAERDANSAVVEAKRAASVVSGGSSATATTTSDNVTPIKSVSEAWAAAKLQMGAN
jgi:hypothetical protein